MNEIERLLLVDAALKRLRELDNVAYESEGVRELTAQTLSELLSQRRHFACEIARLGAAAERVGQIEKTDTADRITESYRVAQALQLNNPARTEPPDNVGRVGKCSKGRLGLITGRKELPWGLSYVGIGLDDGSPWASRAPRLLTQEEISRLDDQVARGRSEGPSAPPQKGTT